METFNLPEITVKEAMTRDLVSVDAEDSLESLIKAFQSHDFHGFPVFYKGKLKGVVTKGDLFKVVGETGIAHVFATHVKDIMTPHPITCSPESTLAEAADLMKENRVRFLPVLRDGEIQGIISHTDIIARILKK